MQSKESELWPNGNGSLHSSSNSAAKELMKAAPAADFTKVNLLLQSPAAEANITTTAYILRTFANEQA